LQAETNEARGNKDKFKKQVPIILSGREARKKSKCGVIIKGKRRASFSPLGNKSKAKHIKSKNKFD
jgi:hypothetical protein